MMDTRIASTHLVITVRRPSGEVERVVRDDLPRILAADNATGERYRAQLREQTRKAGRGDVLSVEIEQIMRPATDEELREDRIADLRKAVVSARTAYDRDEHGSEHLRLAVDRAEAALRAELAR